MRFRPDKLLGVTLVGAHGSYVVRQLVSSGAFAHVVAADGARGLVALKILRPELLHDREMVARLEREAALADRVRHEGVVRVVENVVHAPPFVFFATEHLVGCEVAHLLARRVGVAPPRASRIVAGAARALGATHAAGLVHRDVKPENLFLEHAADGGERVKLLDFGAAGPAGTPGYASPEQVTGAPADFPADVYSLGVVFHELLSGRRPGPASSQGLEGAVAADLLRRMLASSPAERPTATEIAEALADGERGPSWGAT
jgi:eukaryotic-like serine/threonine-protein kinase